MREPIAIATRRIRPLLLVAVAFATPTGALPAQNTSGQNGSMNDSVRFSLRVHSQRDGIAERRKLAYLVLWKARPTEEWVDSTAAAADRALNLRRTLAYQDSGRSPLISMQGGVAYPGSDDAVRRELHFPGATIHYATGDSAPFVMVDMTAGRGGSTTTVAWVPSHLPSEETPRQWQSGDTTFTILRSSQDDLGIVIGRAPQVAAFAGSRNEPRGIRRADRIDGFPIPVGAITGPGECMVTPIPRTPERAVAKYYPRVQDAVHQRVAFVNAEGRILAFVESRGMLAHVPQPGHPGRALPVYPAAPGTTPLFTMTLEYDVGTAHLFAIVPNQEPSMLEVPVAAAEAEPRLGKPVDLARDLVRDCLGGG